MNICKLDCSAKIRMCVPHAMYSKTCFLDFPKILQNTNHFPQTHMVVLYQELFLKVIQMYFERCFYLNVKIWEWVFNQFQHTFYEDFWFCFHCNKFGLNIHTSLSAIYQTDLNTCILSIETRYLNALDV